MEMTLGGLLHALMMRCEAREAQRVVFMGWPGQNEPEPASPAADGGHRAGHRAGPGDGGFGGFGGGFGSFGDAANPDMRPGDAVARPPKALVESLEERGGRQLGYVVITRPVRQGRLRLALEEVLTMQLDPLEAQQHSRHAAAVSVSAAATAAATAAGAASEAPPPSMPPPASVPGPPFCCASDQSASEGSVGMGSRVSSGGNLKCASLTKSSSRVIMAVGGQAQGEAAHSGARLLLAEDNAINMKVALGILKRMGYTDVVTAWDGEEALAALHARGGPDAFDAILMDLHMPRKVGVWGAGGCRGGAGWRGRGRGEVATVPRAAAAAGCCCCCCYCSPTH